MLALLAANPNAERGVNDLGSLIIAGMEAAGEKVLAANPGARTGINLGGTAIIAGMEAAGEKVLAANPSVAPRPTSGGTAIAVGRLVIIRRHGSAAEGGSAAGSDGAPWPEGVPVSVDHKVAKRLAGVRAALSSYADGSIGNDRVAHCLHPRCIGPKFGRWPYLVAVPAGKKLPTAHFLSDAAGGGETCNRALQYISAKEATRYKSSAEFEYLSVAADVARAA